MNRTQSCFRVVTRVRKSHDVATRRIFLLLFYLYAFHSRVEPPRLLSLGIVKPFCHCAAIKENLPLIFKIVHFVYCDFNNARILMSVNSSHLVVTRVCEQSKCNDIHGEKFTIKITVEFCNWRTYNALIIFQFHMWYLYFRNRSLLLENFK